MRARSVLSEAARNLLSGTTRAAALVFAFLLLCGMIGTIEGMSLNAILRDGEEFQAAGGATYVLSAQAGVDGVQCENLARSAGVVGAGALRDVAAGRLSALPISGVGLKEATPGLLRAIAPATGLRQPDRDGVLMPEELAASLGALPGGTLATSVGPLVVAGTFRYPDDGRDPVLANSMLGVIPAGGVFDECWMSVWPYDPATVQLLRTALVASFPPNGDVAIRQLNTRHGERFDGARRFAERPTRYAPFLALLLTTLLGFVGVWSRRLALASDRHVGARRGDQLAQLVVESAAWCAAAVVVFLVMMRLVLLPGGDSPFVFHDVMRIGLIGAGGVLLGTVLAWASIREKQLFAYFKHR
ncbi:hypothetical protein ACFFX1_34495 [Dactylosporangium sucinum]|uniref:Uncharacterized protein n=1 Tax=Dactylosporangium sucinum TaxID=1424081 RepID=A0A917U1L8_9ACTN|nr:hypothetical protein [Dactylosporangium sucinum]GGM51120.1 hypothetical protein GCM10007977_061160 [Dactylosporangium sucinum]